MFFSLKGIVFALLCVACNLINFFFKNYIFKPLYYSMGRSSLPLLGQGERPHDHPRLDMLENYYSESISFGMPSGHSQSILFFATFWIIYILMEFKEKKSNADIIYKIIQALFGQDIQIRFRPSYFPFTEPSAEVDILSNDGKWLEILGCGVVNPIVLENCKINSNKYSGFAFGLGIERIAMLKYGVSDIRDFYKSNLDFLSQFK